MLNSNLDKIRLDITFLKVKQILNLFFLLYTVSKQTYWINLIITVKSRCCYLQRLLIPKKITLARLACLCLVKSSMTKYMYVTSGQNFALYFKFVKVCRCCNRTLLVRNQLVDTFAKETSVELVKIVVERASQSNHVSLEPLFLELKPCRPRGTGG